VSPLAVAQEIPNAPEYAIPRNHQSTIRTGDLVVNIETRVVTAEGKPVSLTPNEYSIFELLSRRKGTTVTKEMLLGYLYGGIDEPAMKIIDVFVCQMRKKLARGTGGKHYIETVWGRGYRLSDPAEIPLLPTLDILNHDSELAPPAGSPLYQMGTLIKGVAAGERRLPRAMCRSGSNIGNTLFRKAV